MRLLINLPDSERATKHCRTSPGGRTPNSSRRIPVLPPSSAMETTALRSKLYFFKPRKTTKLPVPPPITTTFFIKWEESQNLFLKVVEKEIKQRVLL